MVSIEMTLGIIGVGLIWIAVPTGSAFVKVMCGIFGGFLVMSCGLCVLLIPICSPVKS